MPQILIVDDSSTVRQQLRVLLQSEGHVVVEAVDGQDGVEKAQKNELDLIILDLNMPKLDGIEVVKLLRAGSHEKTPIFLLTTEGRPDVARRGKLAGATAWIVKPFKPIQLLDAVRRATTGELSKRVRS